MKTFDIPNSTETMAELAWRYGEQGVPCWWDGRTYQFPDGSALTRWRVHTPRSWRFSAEIMDATAVQLGGWETTR